MTLDEIRDLLTVRDSPDQSCVAVNDLLDKHIDHVGTRIRELQSLEKQLTTLRGTCHSTESGKSCEILQTLASPDAGQPANLGSHGGGVH